MTGWEEFSRFSSILKKKPRRILRIKKKRKRRSNIINKVRQIVGGTSRQNLVTQHASEVESHFPKDRLPPFPSQERSQSLSQCNLVELPFARLVMSGYITRLPSVENPRAKDQNVASTRRVSSVLCSEHPRPLLERVARLVRTNLLAKG